jgi:hypothetical protein
VVDQNKLHAEIILLSIVVITGASASGEARNMAQAAAWFNRIGQAAALFGKNLPRIAKSWTKKNPAIPGF